MYVSRVLSCLIALLALCAMPASARTIVFIGNSFTFGANSAVHFYRAETVTDLNGAGPNGKTVGGVPAMFKACLLYTSSSSRDGIGAAVSATSESPIGLVLFSSVQTRR